MENYIVNRLPKHLFWDSDLSLLDDVEHHEKIIVRTFERGDLEDMALVMAYYGREICADVLVNAAYLPERAMIFATNFLNLAADQFRSNQARQYHAL
ncbi:MAG: hypothetical protein KF856_09505 [Cyclobacteriaceae bacterium]|nr:hypothetical protein [Cyclobacteriaceae bacterium]